jgi:hypothetical protein
MRTLLRNTATGLYVQGPGEWTNSLEQAHNFKFMDLAVKKVETWQLQGVELVFALDHSQQLLATMPLNGVGGEWATA